MKNLRKKKGVDSSNNKIEIVVRKARPSDAPSFLQLVRELAKFEDLTPPTPIAAKRLARDTFKAKKLNLFLAFCDVKAVGYAIYFFTYSTFLARPTLYLEDLFVLEGFRGRGIGKMLFSRCVHEAQRLGCGRMEWAVLTWNKNAIRFYESVGARRLEEWYYYRLDGTSLDKMTAVLKGKG